MANTVNILKTAVAGFMQRDPTVFIRTASPSTVDLLLQACNNARLYVERLLDLELSKVMVDFPNATLSAGVALSTAVLTGTATSVALKKITRPYLPLGGGQPSYPVQLWTKATWTSHLRRRFDMQKPLDSQMIIQITQSPYVVVQDGGTLFVVPPDTNIFTTSFTIQADAIRWLTPYTTGSENDFLLDYCFDWMMYRCIWELNFFLKEDERVMISQTLIKDAWDSVVKWNTELLQNSTDDVNLD